jgi:hypothetical protein
VFDDFTVRSDNILDGDPLFNEGPEHEVVVLLIVQDVIIVAVATTTISLRSSDTSIDVPSKCLMKYPSRVVDIFLVSGLSTYWIGASVVNS